MYLQTDEQTIADLRLFPGRDQSGILQIYNETSTHGGEALMMDMFHHPLCDPDEITRRSGIIAAFAGMGTRFPFAGAVLDGVEKYLRLGMEDDGSSANPGEREIASGVAAVITWLQQMREFVETGDVAGVKGLEQERMELRQLFADPALAPVFQDASRQKLSFAATTAFDVLLRQREKSKILRVLNITYLLDVFIAVAGVANTRRFIFAKPLPRASGALRVEGVYHPELKNAVANDLSLDNSRNIIFLTGANMAGKSTFLRAFSTAVYIAHMGFPVAASYMEFPVMDGIFTTINLPDNLGIGASHFYAEVLRVKKVAAALHSGKSLFILFDELFRGTNVKDAHEGTVAVIQAFAERKDSLFIISSHIVEAGEELSATPGVAFCYLPTRMKGHQPEYTYRLEQGITDDRHGMIIIRNEGILDILKNGKKR